MSAETSSSTSVDPHPTSVVDTVARASDIVPHVWPIHQFIASNPLQDLVELPFEEAVQVGTQWFGCAFSQPSAAPHDPNPALETINRMLIKWSKAFLDENEATWSMPHRTQGFYSAWLHMASLDPTLHQHQADHKAWLSTLPSDPSSSLVHSLHTLRVPTPHWESFLRQALAQLPGWAGYIKWRNMWRSSSTPDPHPITLVDFLAVRMAITCIVWPDAMKHTTLLSSTTRLDNHILPNMEKAEARYRQHLLSQVLAHLPLPQAPSTPAADWVFCIDVRSEPFRRHLEQQGAHRTWSLAGFFGLPLCFTQSDQAPVRSCPVSVSPEHEIATDHQPPRNTRTPFWWPIVRRAKACWSKHASALQRSYNPHSIPLDDQIRYAEKTLRIMGLTSFGPLVVFCGHGSSTQNNPYAAALHCSACGGNPGGPNAQVMAQILNHPDVRAGLAARGIAIPKDTCFLSALHNTTTDEVTLYDQHVVDPKQIERIQHIKLDLIKAGLANNVTRWKQLNAQRDTEPTADMLRRSSDWGEVRPEWGLAGNASFIAGPRSLTQHVDLQSRCFLHSYDWTQDPDGTCLEAIMTASTVVAQWINAQYLFSSVDHVAYGSGSKITHNVVGNVGVMQGNASDLMHGLPLQSVRSDDDTAYHEPMRLQALVYAPCDRITPIVETHRKVSNLVLNGWIILLALDPRDHHVYRMDRQGQWQRIQDGQQATGAL